MPILIKDVNWTQTEDCVQVFVKFNNTKSKSTDLLTSRKYLKVHSPPYFLELFLLHEIDNDATQCKIFPNSVQFSLKKLEKIQWDSLEREADQNEKAFIRNEAIKEKQESTVEKHKESIKYHEQIKRDEIMQSTSRDAKIREDYQDIMKGAVATELKSNMKDNEKSEKIPSMTQQQTKQQQQKISLNKEAHCNNINSVPNIRKSLNIAVTFSNRNFITPKRESQENEEREWLLKQKETQRATGFLEEDLRPEERNPYWLKEKGDNFYKQNNYLAAISAYSTAIRMSDQYWELYMNRAAAHFAIENFKKCTEDCSRALELLVPPCESNLEARKNCLARRGAALAKLGLIKQGYDEIVAALKLRYDKVLERDAEMLRCQLESEK